MGPVQLDEITSSTLLAGRYRCEELLSETPSTDGPVRMWRAVDEVLSRPVVAQVVAHDHPCAQRLVAAARSAAAVNDPRLVSVFDAHVDGVAYVVREWFDAPNLDTILGQGPMSPERAGAVAREVAEALAVAHAAGLAHRRLDLQCVLVTPDDGVKLLGLATDLAVEGLSPQASGPDVWPDPGARDDARGVGQVLHACLTGRWAGESPSQLQRAPRDADGEPLSPRQVRAGVPRPLDMVAERALRDHPRHGPALASPAEVAAALADVGAGPADEAVPAFSLPPVQPDLVAREQADVEQITATPHARSAEVDTEFSLAAQAAAGEDDAGLDETLRPPPAVVGAGRLATNGARRSRPPARTYRRRRIGAGLVAVLVLAGAVLLGWQLTLAALDHSHPPAGLTADRGATQSPSASPTDTGAGTHPFKIADAGDFDPYGNHQEHPELVADAYDGKTSTAWTTMEYYGSPHLGKLKPGVGLWVDLGAVRPVGLVDLDLLGRGTDLDVLVPRDPNANSAPTAFDSWRNVGSVTDAGARSTIRLDGVSTRFVLVWLTKLPRDDTGNYRGGIREITVRG
jgi:putative peptidoglycan lipid II flippase